ncbi:MAG: glycosyltransferase [Sedimentisphaerales bacterium]|nr:glycosyltransferase [Sedimentisphaerales bacterium]
MITVVHKHDIWLPPQQNWIYHQVKYLPADVEAHVVCRRIENADQYGLDRLHCQPISTRWAPLERFGLGALRRRREQAFLRRVIGQVRADLLHSHFGYEAWRNRRALADQSIRHVVTFYGVDVNHYPQRDPRWRDRYRRMFADLDAVLCEGPFMARCVERLGCPAAKLHVQHLGVPIDRIAYRPRRWRPNEPLRVLMAASFREKKGLCYGLEALGRLRADVPLEITIIGDALPEQRSRREKEKILRTIGTCQLGRQVRLLGVQPYAVFLAEAYNHHLFLSPSVTAADGDTEGGAPVSLIDMAASGMPIVSTIHCDIPEVIQDGVTGFLAEQRSVDQLEGLLRRLIERPDDWPAMLQAGRRRMEQQFDAARQALRLAQIYRQVVG